MTGGHVREFVRDFCGRHGVPPAFYEALVAREYPEGEVAQGRQVPGVPPRQYPEPVVVT
jgi:hypothetical protein